MARISTVPISYIDELKEIKRAPESLYYIGDLSLLKRPKVSIVGTRRPSGYTKNLTKELASQLAKRGVAIVSGAAMGVDAVAHIGAGASNTIAVMGNGLDIRYPTVNEQLIAKIEESGLVLSQFENGMRATNWSFVVRNSIVVTLGEVLVVAEADMDSGSFRSAEIAMKMKKPIYVLPHRLGESRGTNWLLRESKAKAIYDIESFADMFGAAPTVEIEKDEFFYFCQTNPTLEQAVARFGHRVYDAELSGEIVIEDGKIRVV